VGPAEDPERFDVIDEFLAAGQVGYQCGDLTIFDGNLSFNYNGTDNIYIGGPDVWSPTSVPANGQYGNLWGTQGGLRRMICDSKMEITGPGGMIPVQISYPYWSPPINIKNILNVGTNHLTIVVKEIGVQGWSGCTDLYIRNGF